MNLKVRLLAMSVLLLYVLPSSIPSFAIVRADSLVIQDDGTVILIVGDNVMGVSIADSKATGAAPSTAPAPSSKPSSPPPAPSKIVPITAPNTHSVVQAVPSPKGGNKLQVTVTTPPPGAPSAAKPSAPSAPITTTSSPLPVSGQRPSSSVLPSPVSATPGPTTSATPPATVNEQVDKVILQSAPSTPLLTIQPNATNPNNQMTIQQGNTGVNTTLPLDIDTQTHSVSAEIGGTPVKLNVLPNEAVKGAVDQGLLSNIAPAQSNPVSLDQSQGQPVYTIHGTKSGNLFGFIPMSAPVTVQMSPQTGTVVNISQPLIFTVFGNFLSR